jgi:hypothetical protein
MVKSTGGPEKHEWRQTMVSSKAKSVEEYLQELPEERRKVVEQVRETILGNLPEGYQESMNWGMITYEIPLERYPKTYNQQPLGYAALAAQKNYYSLYVMCAYTGSAQEALIRDGFAQVGKRLDMGKACIRFKKLEDLPLEVIGRAIASTSPEEYIRQYEAARR